MFSNCSSVLQASLCLFIILAMKISILYITKKYNSANNFHYLSLNFSNKLEKGFIGCSFSPRQKLSWMLHGLHRTAKFRINHIFIFLLLDISSSCIERSLHAKFQLPRLPGSGTFNLGVNPILRGWGVQVTLIVFLIFQLVGL